MRTRWLETLVISLGFTTIGLVGCKGDDEGSSTGNADVEGSGSSESAGSTMTGDTTTTATTDTGCTPGELGCDCSGGLCLGDLECNNGICSDPNCSPGELACECDNGLCLGDLVCVGGVCLEDGGTTTGTTDTTSTTGMDTSTETTADTGMECPNANEMMCDGVCVDVLANVDHCGTCGKTCEINGNNDVGGCEDGQCKPYWSECHVEGDGFTTCNDICANEGQTCVELACGPYTWMTSGIGFCTLGSLSGNGVLGACDGQLQWTATYLRCCCTQ